MNGNAIEVKEMPTKDDIQAFWKSIWNVKYIAIPTLHGLTS